ncbi:MAG: ectoine hydroxylase-related dioxygenase (phytanoyl-CoA dioxygenase family) [Kiritimatiellia bacterium]|jgi:ectoine hydroxylase-related dioxygenase (phytanoyl-CoA dioxygenase family)
MKSKHKSKPNSKPDSYDYLSKAQQKSADVSSEWDQDNQQWWNWYMTLAENKDERNSLAARIKPYKLDPLTDIDESTLTHIGDELSEPYKLSRASIAQFSRDGYIKLKNVIDTQHLTLLRQRINAMLIEALGREPGLAFRSDEMMWLRDELVRRFVLSKRVAQIASELLDVQAVRLYHDNALSKEPGCGRTPWHYDYHHFPIDSLKVCTAWIPLQTIPEEMGPLAFAAGMETYKLVQDLPFNKFDASYDKQLSQIFAENHVPVDDSSFDLGDISFHHTLSFHTAGANKTSASRMALATTYFEDGARLVSNPTMISGDFLKFMPGIEPGERINSDYNPVCYKSPQ